MSNEIRFTTRATSEEAARQQWIAAGIPYQATASTGAVQYGDMRDISTPVNVRQ